MNPTIENGPIKSFKKIRSLQHIKKKQQSPDTRNQQIYKRKKINLTNSRQVSNIKQQQKNQQQIMPAQQSKEQNTLPDQQNQAGKQEITHRELIISRKEQLKLRLAKVLKPLYLSRSKIMMDAYPQTRTINMYSLSQTHKDNVLINPPVQYIVDNKNYRDDIKHTRPAGVGNMQDFMQPRREQIDIQKVQFFEQDNGFSLNTRVDIIDTVKQSMQNWNFSDTQKYNQRAGRKEDQNLKIERAISRKYLKTASMKRPKTRSEDDSYTCNTFVKGEKMNIQQFYKTAAAQRIRSLSPQQMDRRTNLGANLDFYMKSEPTIQKVPINSQGISLCGSYGSQQFIKKIAE